jgi:hypothetical protein
MMKKPEYYDLKKWLCENTIVGLRVSQTVTGCDTMDVYWVLEPAAGVHKRVRDTTVQGLVDIHPDWIRVLDVKDKVRAEVDAWDAFAKKEARDLSEYKRLKEKFEGVKDDV